MSVMYSKFFLLDLESYMHGLGYGLLLATWRKFFFAEPCKVLSMDLSINLKSFITPLISGNITYLHFLDITAEAKYHKKRMGKKKRYANAPQLDFLALILTFIIVSITTCLYNHH